MINQDRTPTFCFSDVAYKKRKKDIILLSIASFSENRIECFNLKILEILNSRSFYRSSTNDFDITFKFTMELL